MVAEAIQLQDPGGDSQRGVALLQLAAVHAAVAEGFALDEVLEVEGLPQLPWFEAEVSWKARLVADAELFARYEELVAEHQERLARPVLPLDDDVEAWVVFLRVYGSHPKPFELLEQLGLGMNDLARLSRLWRRRFDTQPKVAKQAEKLVAKYERRWQRHAEQPPLPPIRVGEARLLASTLAGSYAAAEQQGAAGDEAVATAAPVLGLDRYAGLVAELELEGPSGRGAVLERFELEDADAAAIDEAWRARLDSDTELRADFRILVAHYRNTASRRRRAGLSDPVLPVRPAPAPAHPCVPMVHVPSGRPMWAADPLGRAPNPLDVTAVAIPALAASDVLPFSGRVAAPPLASASQPPRTGDLEGTSALIPALLEAEVTPFDDEPRVRAAELLAPPATDATVVLPTGRGRFITLPFRGSIPFLPSRVTELPPGPPGGELDGTSALIPALLDQPALPFDSDEPAEIRDEPPQAKPVRARASERRHAVEVRAPRPIARSELDATHLIPLLVLDDEPSSSPPATDAGAPTSPGPSGVAPQPQARGSHGPELTLEQLASLHAELAHAGERPEAIRARYHLRDEASQRQLEALWWQRFAAHPEEHVRYLHKLREFQAWLRERRR